MSRTSSLNDTKSAPSPWPLRCGNNLACWLFTSIQWRGLCGPERTVSYLDICGQANPLTTLCCKGIDTRSRNENNNTNNRSHIQMKERCPSVSVNILLSEQVLVNSADGGTPHRRPLQNETSKLRTQWVGATLSFKPIWPMNFHLSSGSLENHSSFIHVKPSDTLTLPSVTWQSLIRMA